MKNLTLIGFISGFILLSCSFVSDHEKKVQKTDNAGSWDKLMLTASSSGKKSWQPMLKYQMWRGPAWNSMTYWVARGCLRYGRKDAAKILLERALDDSARQFEATGTIWEFYHPDGGDQSLVKRKPQTKQNIPCKDYLGHNPLIAMAIMYDSVK